MRTLKKSLALVLALVMLLGLGVVGASADNALDNYTDADEIGDAYLEAVGVLTGLGIVDGMTETTIVPQATYTRAQAAKIITTMVLGVNGAKSCVASYAPFDDVAANHWAAGYIAFCKEQGIIDGVTDTTFDPEGTLTGYQWAKMLLAAVGFNANNELEGSSWSLNTARIGREVGLFDGDLAGADHTPLRREQAMLYAFNTLSGIRQVTYTANGDNYVYGIWGYEWADGTGYTLGEKVFKLDYVEGVIQSNEGMGYDATVLYDVNNQANRWGKEPETFTVKADTGIDLLQHAVRVWFVDGKEDVGVYTHDLAKTTTYTCYDIADGEKAYGDLKTSSKTTTSYGTGNGAQPYEYVLVDNTAYDYSKDYVGVTYYYYESYLGVHSNVNETQVIGGTAVSDDLVMTDVSDIDYMQDVIVLHIGDAYYVYTYGATSGVIRRVSNINKTITLNDGTVLELSVFAKNIDLDALDIDETYSFVLDTHGHVVSLANELGVSYFTGTVRDTNSHDAWWGEADMVAQFVNIVTGEVSEVPVTSAWAFSHENHAGAYYDLKDVDGNDNYSPKKINTADGSSENPYGEVYFINAETKFDGDTHSVVADGQKIYFDEDSVVFMIATGKGTNLDVQPYTGIDALLEHYNKLGAENTVTLKNIAITTVDTTGSYPAATVIFAYDGIVSTSGGYLFVPENISINDWDKDGTSYIYPEGVYLNGSDVASIGELRVSSKQTIARGFYSYTVDAKGIFTLGNKLSVDTYVYDYSKVAVTADGGRTWLEAGGKEYEITGWSVVDLRTGKVDKVTDVSGLVGGKLNDYENARLALAFVPSAKVIYVVDIGTLNEVTLYVGDELSSAWNAAYTKKYDADVNDTIKVDVVMSNDELDLAENTKFTVKYTAYNSSNTTGTEKTADATVNENGDLEFQVEYKAKNFEDSWIVIDSIPVTVQVSLANAGTDYDGYKTYKANLGDTVTITNKRETASSVSAGDVEAIVGVNTDVRENAIYIAGTLSEDQRTATWTYTPSTNSVHLYFMGVRDAE